MDTWYVYILKCKNNYLYTGITIDIQNRLNNHQKGMGAKALRGRLPIKLVYLEKVADKTAALKREIEIKSWKKEKKENFIIRSASSTGRAVPS